MMPMVITAEPSTPYIKRTISIHAPYTLTKMDSVAHLIGEYVAAKFSLSMVDYEYFVLQHQQGPGVNRLEMNVNNPNPGDVFNVIFGNHTVTSPPKRFDNAMHTLGQIEKNGWNGPRQEANIGIDTLNNMTEYHIWLVEWVNHNRIIYYPDEQITPLCLHKINSNIRRP